MNFIILGLVFYGIVTPVALLMRFFRRDALRLRFRQEMATYWIERNPTGPKGSSFKNQY